MANPFCLLPQHADAFLAKVKSGELAPDKLAKMSPEERHAAFAEIMGEAAAEKVNASFESRLLLKSQQRAIADWIEKAGKAAPEVKRDLLARVGRMEGVLNPKTAQPFFADLAKQRLGFRVTQGEAAKVVSLSKEIQEAKAANDEGRYWKAQTAFTEYTGELKGRDPLTLGKGIAATARFAALTWPTTLGKLVGAALGRGVVTPLEDIVGVGASKVLPKVAGVAGRYATADYGTAFNAEAAAQTASWTKGMMDAGRLLQNKASTLELMHGEGGIPKAWWDYPGSLHAALKSTTQWAEYARALYRRNAASLERGEDLNDMTIKIRNSMDAFKDSERALLKQDNVVVSAWNAGLRRLEASSKATGKPNVAGQALSAAIQTEVPIVKIPTNIVHEVSEVLGGLPWGAAKGLWYQLKGIEDLEPVEADAIIRQISKGSLGAALMTLAYFKHDAIELGGYYQPGEHRKPGAVGPLGIRIFGHDLPTAVSHIPLLNAMQFAATTGHVYGTYNSKTKAPNGVGEALSAAALGLLDEIPIINQPYRDYKAAHEQGLGEMLSGKAADVPIPGIVKWVAKEIDTGPRGRNPKGLKQHIEANIPGLRKNVPIKR